MAAGYLKLWARRQGLEERCAIEILPANEANRLGDAALVERISALRPAIVGFTCYLWNIDRTLWVAARLKERHPALRVVLGGPEITLDNAWVQADPAWDYLAIGEGERTFTELLAHWLQGSPALEAIAGLVFRAGGKLVRTAPRAPMAALDLISSPYLEGILDAGDQEQLLLETIRGCIFKCKFCYYPKAYDGLTFVSREKVLANLEHARRQGAREVYLLDPTLNQRRDFAEFLEVLREGNPDGTLEYYAELRGEGIRPEHARQMRAANVKEVEIGLQSVDPKAQETMNRRNSLRAFEQGVRALQAEGVQVKVDLIVGLPDDTVESVRRGMCYLAESRLYDDIQVFQLSILPGTEFRGEAARRGLEHQDRPPYYVLRTPTMELAAIRELQLEAEEIFDVAFDPEPPPALGGELEPGRGLLRVDLDAPEAPALPPARDRAFTLWLRAEDLYRRLPKATRLLREVLARDPFVTLQIVLETDEDFPFNVFDGLQAACAQPENNYLDRFYAFTPRSHLGAKRLVTVFPAERRAAFDPSWVEDALSRSDVVWREPGAGADGELEPLASAGEWRWRPARERLKTVLPPPAPAAAARARAARSGTRGSRRSPG